MAPRRPSTANDAGPSRIPFTSAEALLWGPEMKKQHAYLLTEMRVLQKQHEGYDSRIRATEDVADAAKAATARVRHLEQQLDAIKAEDDDKAFEKWASGEMTRLSIFVDTNKNVRQKQMELDAEVSRISETLDRVVRVPADLKSLLRRLDTLEHDRREDKHRIQSLEEEINRLKCMRPSNHSSLFNPRAKPKAKKGITKSSTPTQILDAEVSDATTETDEEEMLLQRTNIRDEVQVPQSLATNEKSSSPLVTSPTKGSSIISARQRLLQRPSIHDSMLPRPAEEQPTLAEDSATNLRRASPPPTQLVVRGSRCNEPAPAPEPEPQPEPESEVTPANTSNAPTNEAPATQIVERKWPRKRKQPDPEPQTQRQTRSQARRNQAKETEVPITTGAVAVPEPQSAPKIEPISSPRKKLKVTPVDPPARGKAKSGAKNQTTSRNTKKTQKQRAVEGPGEQESTTHTQQVSTTTKKVTAAPKKKANLALPPSTVTNPKVHKSLIVKLPCSRKPVHVGMGDIGDLQPSAAARGRMSPQKVAAGPSSPFKVLRNPVKSRK